jgi:bifunctional non-homologous end joining protein LigD
MAGSHTTLHVAGRDVKISNPEKVYFPQAGVTKLELVQYYLHVDEPVLRAIRGRPMILRRFVHGIEGEPFFQKRAPENRPEWIETATFKYPSGGVADEIVVNDPASLAWVVNLGCVEMHVHPIRADDLEHPDELRIDLDPQTGSTWGDVVAVAKVAHAVLDDFKMIGWPKTSGSRGAHIWVRIERKWPFTEVRRAGLALAREIERRIPDLATSAWQKEERHGVLVDYNQNAKDRTTAAAWSVRPTPDARVSMPLSWRDLEACNPADFTIKTVPSLVAKNGDAHAHIDDKAFSLDALLELADKQEPRKVRSKKTAPPLITIAQAKAKADVMDGLERWKAKHPDVVTHLKPSDILIDTNRGRSSAWYRVRINLKNVPEAIRPPQGTPDPDYDWKTEEAPKIPT